MSSVRFKLDRQAARKALLTQNMTMQNIQRAEMNTIMSTIASAFLSEFGFAGKFELGEWTTDRTTISIRGANPRTTATLKKHPKWLSTFLSNI